MKTEVHPFEVLILPFNMPLECGYTLRSSNVETVYQNESVLILKGNRPVEAHFDGGKTGHDLTVHAIDPIDKLDVTTKEGCTILKCPELPPDGYRSLKIGKLNVYILGQMLVDTFWLQEDGQMVIGAHERLPNNQYGLAHDHYRLFFIAPSGNEIREERIREGVVVDTPRLIHWQVYDEATELRGAGDFKPVAAAGADFDANGLYEGSAWYRYNLQGRKPSEVEIEARHIWAVFLNGELLGHDHQLSLIHGLESPPPKKLQIPDNLWDASGPNQLMIFVDGLGHPKGFHDDAQTSEGLLMLKVDDQDVTSDMEMSADFRSGNAGNSHLGQIPRPEEQSLDAVKKSPVVRLKTEFTLNIDRDADIPWSLQLRNMDYERINIYLNNILIGRYWRDCQRQDTFYLPQGILQTEPDAVNELELIVINFDPFISLKKATPHADHATLVPVEVFTKVSVPAKLEI